MKNKMIELLKKLQSKKAGQGVIEYAGAMIIAALIVIAVLLVATDGMANVYNAIFDGVEQYFTNKAQEIEQAQ